jgi:hypothetical protein
MNLVAEWKIDIETTSEANSREHWGAKYKRHQKQRNWIDYFFLKETPTLRLPCHIQMIRISKGKLDFDNLVCSMKYVRDSIANNIIPGLAPGRADDDERITWEYLQEKGKKIYLLLRMYNI